MTKTTEQKKLDKFFRNLRKLQDWEWSIDDENCIRATIEISTDVNGMKTGTRKCKVCPITAVTLATTGQEFRDVDYTDAAKVIDLKYNNNPRSIASAADNNDEGTATLRQRILKALNLKERIKDAT